MTDERLTDDELQLLVYSFERERFRAAAAHRDNPNMPVFVHVEYSIFDMAARALTELQAARAEIARLERETKLLRAMMEEK